MSDVEPSDPIAADASCRPFEVTVIRSARRRKTSQARVTSSGRLEVRIPHYFTKSQEAETVEHFQERFARRAAAELVDLERRAAILADRFRLRQPASIRWVSNQQQRWGSCTPVDGTVRLSDRMANFPDWVIDYVIVHELAHLSHSGHGAAFWRLVERYPMTERARGFLIAQAWEPPTPI